MLRVYLYMLMRSKEGYVEPVFSPVSLSTLLDDTDLIFNSEYVLWFLA